MSVHLSWNVFLSTFLAKRYPQFPSKYLRYPSNKWLVVMRKGGSARPCPVGTRSGLYSLVNRHFIGLLRTQTFGFTFCRWIQFTKLTVPTCHNNLRREKWIHGRRGYDVVTECSKDLRRHCFMYRPFFLWPTIQYVFIVISINTAL